MPGPYEIVLADPPWAFKNKNTGGSLSSGSANQYDVLNLNKICSFLFDNNVAVADDAVLFMWWVASMPEEALRVVRAWDFGLKTMHGFSWVKLTKNAKLHFGLGFWTRQGTESCLIATRGKPKRLCASVRELMIENCTEDYEGVIVDPVRQHSEKPSLVREKIVALFGDKPRIELFARQRVLGWNAIGFELPKEGCDK